MALSPGDKVGPYEIVAPIGKGGMGEAYKARDTRLDRIVTLKVSAEQVNERFERKAKAIAALNHPNICILPDAQALARLYQMSGAAVSTFGKIMVDQNTPPSTRLGAADGVLSRIAQEIELQDIETRVAELERGDGHKP